MFDKVGTAANTVGNASNGDRSMDHCAADILNIVATADSAGTESTADSESPNTVPHMPGRGARRRRREAGSKMSQSR